jgi:membrane-bound serine protease (ClpP class)
LRFLTWWKLALSAILCAVSLSAQVYAVATPLVATSVRERVLVAIADPNIALLLVVLGALGIYAEFCSPGLFAPGVIGALFLFLGLTAVSRLPINRPGAALMILGLAFCVLEAKWSTRGILAAAGAFGLALGGVTLIDAASPGLRVRWSTALVLAIPFALATSFLLSVASRARRNKVGLPLRNTDRGTNSATTDRNPATLFTDAPRRIL